MTAKVLTERAAHVLIITINRPEVRNAIDLAVSQAVADALDLLDTDATLRVGVLTGAGGNFSSGMDLQAFLAGEPIEIGSRGVLGLTKQPPAKPLIAAVEGYALAGGFEAALACDLIVASVTARFGMPEVRRGLAATAGGLLRLPRQIPPRIAMELVLTGRHIAASRAERLGLINQVVAPGKALGAALSLASCIAANAPLAVEASKRIVNEQQDWSLEDRFDRQQRIAGSIIGSDDAQEGARAFFEKRPPVWGTAKANGA
jgi:enoyl-CoA hydratase